MVKCLQYFYNGEKIEIRPIVLGGDDLTVICRADKALTYTHSFLHHFEEETKALKDILKKYKVFTKGEDHLTACAGIAIIKEKGLLNLLNKAHGNAFCTK